MCDLKADEDENDLAMQICTGATHVLGRLQDIL